MSEPKFVPLHNYRAYDEDEMRRRARAFYEEASRRRTVRDFSDQPVDPQVISDCLRAAGTAPSGANMQPWHFVVVTDLETKRRIREAAEREERDFYEKRAPQEWLDALAALGTDANKPFLEEAPVLIAIFVQSSGIRADGSAMKHYYAVESVGLAAGILISALHHCGVATLTHTPSPMGFLNEILDRPANERPFLLLVAGFPADGAQVPDITRKSLDEYVTSV